MIQDDEACCALVASAMRLGVCSFDCAEIYGCVRVCVCVLCVDIASGFLTKLFVCLRYGSETDAPNVAWALHWFVHPIFVVVVVVVVVV